MRSKRAFIGAAIIVLSYPLALGVGLVGGGAETAIHLVMGTGFVVFATSVFDFALPRWINVVGAVAAATFGVIFLLQGVSDLTHVEALRYVAFDLLGHHVERLLPDVVYLWSVALLLLASTGWSRWLGWAVMLVVVGLEAATFVTLVLGSPDGERQGPDPACPSSGCCWRVRSECPDAAGDLLSRYGEKGPWTINDGPSRHSPRPAVGARADLPRAGPRVARPLPPVGSTSRSFTKPHNQDRHPVPTYTQPNDMTPPPWVGNRDANPR